MRKIIVISMISLDGVIQGPGGPEEDISGGFEYGGWVATYGDAVLSDVVKEQMKPTDVLLGRKTFEIWENYWPKNAEHWSGINDVTKYVLSKTRKGSTWRNSIFLESIEEIKELKSQEYSGSRSSEIKVWGSSELFQLLLENDLVDELWLNIYPVILGKGKKLFGNSEIPTAFRLSKSKITTTGVIIANYKKDGTLKTGVIRK